MPEAWPIEREERLRHLWAEGYSSGAIGFDLGCSRNAAMGKINRLKLPSPSIKQVAIARPPPPKSAEEPKGFSPNSLESRIAGALEAPGLDDHGKGEMPDGTGIQVRDLTALNCHWPKGDPKTPEFEFCGAKAVPGLPYCTAHCRLSYQPPR